MDSDKSIVAESGIQEMKIIVPGAKIGIQRITDMDGNGHRHRQRFHGDRDEQVLIHGSSPIPPKPNT